MNFRMPDVSEECLPAFNSFTLISGWFFYIGAILASYLNPSADILWIELEFLALLFFGLSLLIDRRSFFDPGIYSFENFLRPEDGCARGLAIFCLIWAGFFVASTRTAGHLVDGRTLLILANDLLAVLMGSLQAYYWMISR